MLEQNVKIPASGPGSYKVFVGSRMLHSLWARTETEFPHRAKFVVTDQNLVSAGHLDSLLGPAKPSTFVISPPGETSKNMTTIVSIIEAMEDACLGRDSLIVALGGGTVGDVAAFAASIFKRGVPVVQIPTTTVAQADSAIGGKTGVDSSTSKNAFGTFWHPAAGHAGRPAFPGRARRVGEARRYR
jgi:3-dehydroquinate synthase